MKQLEPIIPAEQELHEAKVELLLDAIEKEERLTGRQFKNIHTLDLTLSRLEVSASKFTACRFMNAVFTRSEFVDVIFEACDFSGCDFSNSYFSRVQFIACKGVGTNFTNNTMTHTTFIDCHLCYANFDDSKFEYVNMKMVELDSGSLSQCRCKFLTFSQTQLINVNFFKTSLKGIDFTNSTITGLILSDDNKELNGAIVDTYQAAELAKRLGVIIIQ